MDRSRGGVLIAVVGRPRLWGDLTNVVERRLSRGDLTAVASLHPLPPPRGQFFCRSPALSDDIEQLSKRRCSPPSTNKKRAAPPHQNAPAQPHLPQPPEGCCRESGGLRRQNPLGHGGPSWPGTRSDLSPCLESPRTAPPPPTGAATRSPKRNTLSRGSLLDKGS